MTERQRSERARLCEARVQRRWRQNEARRKCKRLHPPRPPRVLLSPEQRADVSRANLKKANAARSSNRTTPEPIRTLWWLSKL